MYEQPAYGQYPAEPEETARPQAPAEPVRRPASTGVSAAVAQSEPEPEPGRDRLLVHLGWEALLLVAVVLLAVYLHRDRPELFRGAGLDTLLVAVVAIGLLGLAAGLSLRTAAPNLAIGPVTVASALHFAEQGDQGVVAATAPVLVAAAVGGLLLGLVVVVLHVPGWAAGLAAAGAVVVLVQQRPAAAVAGGFEPTEKALPLFAGFAAVALLGGLFGAVGALRRVLGRYRPVGDPALRRGVAAAVLTVLALSASTVLAAAAGTLIAATATTTVAPSPGFDWTILGFGVAMLGGASAFGRRGGIAGTFLAAVLVTLVLGLALLPDASAGRYAVGAAALGLGLIVTRLVEWRGRPRSAVAAVRPTTVDETDWGSLRGTTNPSWYPLLPERAVESEPAPREATRWEQEQNWWEQAPRWGGPSR